MDKTQLKNPLKIQIFKGFKLLYFADNAHRGLLCALTERIIAENFREKLAVKRLFACTENLAREVIDIDDNRLEADSLCNFLCDLIRIFGAENDALVIGRECIRCGAVDGFCTIARNLIEPSALSEKLAYCGNECRKEKADCSAFAERHLHRLGNSEPDSVGGFIDELAE